MSKTIYMTYGKSDKVIVLWKRANNLTLGEGGACGGKGLD